MAVNSVKFRIEGDGTSALKALNDVKRGMNDVRDVVAKEISTKIKQVFSVAAIEEMTRRTAEWATNLQNTAKQLQVTTGELQGFQLAGSRMGLDSGKIEGFFGTMEDAAREALKGNAELLVSFGKLGIKMNELRNMKPAQLFEKIIAGAGSGNTGFEGAAEIFGRGNALELQRMNGVMGGQSGSKFAEESGMAVGDENIRAIVASWRNILDGLKQLGTQLSPLVTVILSLVNGIIKMVTGIIGTITGIVGDISSALGHASTGDFGAAGKSLLKIPGRFAAIGAGLGKFATLGFADESIDNYMADTYKMTGLTKAESGMGEGAGEGIGNVLTFGVGAAAKGLGAGASALKMGGLGAKLGKFGSSGGMLQEGAFGKLAKMYASRKTKADLTTAMKVAEDIAMKELGITASQAELPLFANARDRMMDHIFDVWAGKGVSGAPMGLAGLSNLGMSNIMKWKNRIGITGQLGSLVGTGGVGAGDIRKMMGELDKGQSPFQGRNPFMNIGAFGGGGAGGSGNLRIGGVFGSDVSFKIMALNQEMAMTLSRMLSIMEESRNPSSYTAVGLH